MFGLPQGFRWREKQKEVVEAAIKAIEEGYKNVLIDAPVGFGKTIANYCIAKYFRDKEGIDAFYTTPQVSLLDQIERDEILGSRIAVVKGRDNYPCVIEPGKTAANGKCTRERNFKCYEECPYKMAKAKALGHWISAMSFAYLIYDRFVPEEYAFGNRGLIIVDEADDLEGWAEEFGSFKFKVEYSQRFESMDDVIVWAKGVLKNVEKKIREYEDIYVLSDDDVKELDRLKKYQIKLKVFLNKVEEDRRNWVFEKQKDDRLMQAWLVVKPVNVGDILNDMIWSRGEIRIASSGTIINKEMFCKTTGLKVKETIMIRVGSVFPVENRRVYFWPVAKMTKELRSDNYGVMAEAVAKIVEKHVGDRGICHAHSYEMAKEIYDRLINSNVVEEYGVRVAMHNSKDRKEVFKKFLDGRIDFLISVGFNRGIDLKYDLARYQVITKVPFPDTSDIRVREIWVNRKAWNWARYQAIKNIVQAYGRIVRAKDDWGVTYILDSSFGHLFRYKMQFPKWFVEAVKEVRSLEELMFCPRCGRPVDESVDYCPTCGECLRCSV